MKQIILVCVCLIGSFVLQTAFGHATVWPRESVAGAFEKYTIRIPNEKESPTIRIEAVFPPNVAVSYFEVVSGWTIEHQTNPDGRIVGAIWNGGRIGANEFAEFALMARNPEASATLVWRVIQVHEDGSRSEWVGAPDSRSPAPNTFVK